MIKYPINTKVSINADRSINKRYCLCLDIKNEETEKRVLMIFMNPSQADENISDRTVNRAFSYFLNVIKPSYPDYTGIEVLNLFPEYLTDSKELFKIVKTINRKNKLALITAIELAIEEKRMIVLGYGNHPKKMKNLHNRQVTFLLELLNNKKIHYVSLLTKDGNPRHACYWHNNLCFHSSIVSGYQFTKKK